MSTQTSTETETETETKPLKNRQGSAIVSMILGVLSAGFVLLAIVMEMVVDGSTVGATFVIIGGVLSLVGFPLGLFARKTSKGREMAILAIALSVLPFLLAITSLLLTILTAIIFLMN